MRLPCPPVWLLIRDLLDLISQLRDDPPHKWCRVVQIPQHFDEGTVIQPRACKMLDLFHIGKTAQRLVIDRPQMVDQRILPAGCLDPDHDLISFFPLGKILRDQINRILEVAYHLNHTVSRCLENPVKRGIELAEILRVKDRLYPPVPRTDLPEDRPCLILRIIIDKNQLIIILLQIMLKERDDRLAHGPDILLLVKAGNQHADLLPCLTHFASLIQSHCKELS